MKKLLTTLVFASTLCLTSCFASSLSYDSVKGSLGEDYNVSHVTIESVEKVFTIPEGVTVKDALFAKNSNTKDKIQVIFFASIDDATKFFDYKDTDGYNANLIALSRLKDSWYEEDGLECKLGMHNNVSYVGTTEAVKKAGLTIEL